MFILLCYSLYFFILHIAILNRQFFTPWPSFSHLKTLLISRHFFSEIWFYDDWICNGSKLTCESKQKNYYETEKHKATQSSRIGVYIGRVMLNKLVTQLVQLSTDEVYHSTRIFTIKPEPDLWAVELGCVSKIKNNNFDRKIIILKILKKLWFGMRIYRKWN